MRKMRQSDRGLKPQRALRRRAWKAEPRSGFERATGRHGADGIRSGERAAALQPATRTSARSCCTPRHPEPDLPAVGFGPRDQACETAVGHHRDAIADCEHLFQLRRNIEYGSAGISQSNDAVENKARRAGIEAPGSLVSNENGRRPVQLARNYDLLLVSTR